MRSIIQAHGGEDGGKFLERCAATEEGVRIVFEAMKAMGDGPAVVQLMQGPDGLIA